MPSMPPQSAGLPGVGRDPPLVALALVQPKASLGSQLGLQGLAGSVQLVAPQSVWVLQLLGWGFVMPTRLNLSTRLSAPRYRVSPLWSNSKSTMLLALTGVRVPFSA